MEKLLRLILIVHKYAAPLIKTAKMVFNFFATEGQLRPS